MSPEMPWLASMYSRVSVTMFLQLAQESGKNHAGWAPKTFVCNFRHRSRLRIDFHNERSVLLRNPGQRCGRLHDPGRTDGEKRIAHSCSGPRALQHLGRKAFTEP